MLEIDLTTQTIVLYEGRSLQFQVDAYRRHALLSGLDEIGLILADDSDEIAAFETRQREASPWLYLSREKRSFFDDLDRERALE
jgi:3-isopropylmalate/(R)-2-methylmalate dehydratase small subunit